MPAELYVGDVLDASESSILKPVRLWDMKKPQTIAELSNRYETGQLSLCGLFCQEGYSIAISTSLVK